MGAEVGERNRVAFAMNTCIFQQGLGGVGSVDDLHQMWQNHAHIRLHLCTYTHSRRATLSNTASSKRKHKKVN